MYSVDEYSTLKKLDKLYNMDKEQYRRYLKSPQWQETRKRFYNSKMFKTYGLKSKSWCCYCCGVKDQPLDLHHRTYKRLGSENIAVDLVTVCRNCHEKIHKEFFSTEKSNLWESTKKIKKLERRKLKSHK